jgi:hypothetical protein
LGRGGKQALLEFPEEELLGALLSKVESVVVDELLLELEPLTPADIADLIENPLADRVRKRAKGDRVAGLAASGTGH